MLPRHLPCLFAIALASCSSSHEQNADPPPLLVAMTLLTPRSPSLPDLDPDTPPPHAPIAIAASPNGLVAFDPLSGAPFASAPTRFRVVDIAHDPWRDRWIASEYDDDSENRVSVWRLLRPVGGLASIVLEREEQTGGYCRVAAGRSSLVAFEGDGLRQRWLLWDAEPQGRAGKAKGAMPAGLVIRDEEGASSFVFASVSDDGSGFRAALGRRPVAQAEAGPIESTELQAWSGTESAVRAADGGPGVIVLAQLSQHTLRVGAVRDDGVALAEPIAIESTGARGAEDLVVDASLGVAFVLVSGSDQVIAVDLARRAEVGRADAPPLPKESPSWFTRLLAYDPRSRRLLVAGADRVRGFDVGDQGDLRAARGFVPPAARRPIAIAAPRP